MRGAVVAYGLAAVPWLAQSLPRTRRGGNTRAGKPRLYAVQRGNVLSERRVALGLTKRQLCDYLLMDVSTLRRVERAPFGVRVDPRLARSRARVRRALDDFVRGRWAP